MRTAMMLAGLAGAGFLGGCQWNQKATPKMSAVSESPLVIDQAMQIRDAELKTCWYPSGAAIAGGTGFLFEPSDKVSPALRRFTDAPVAALNDVTLPAGLIVNSPTKTIAYHGEWVPPTYNAMPPLPPGEQPWEPGVTPPPAPKAAPPRQVEAPAPAEGPPPAPATQEQEIYGQTGAKEQSLPPVQPVPQVQPAEPSTMTTAPAEVYTPPPVAQPTTTTGPADSAQ